MRSQLILPLGLLTLFAYVSIHLFLFRVHQPVEKWKTTRTLFIVIAGVLILFVLLISFGEPDLSIMVPVDLFLCLLLVLLYHVGYLTVYAFIDRSITLRLFVEIRKRGGSVDYEELKEIYNPTLAYQRRLDILVASGYLAQMPSRRYKLTSKGRTTGRLVRLLKALYRLGPGG